MDKFKKWRRKQKSATDVTDVRETTHPTRSSTASEEPTPPRYETDPPPPAPHQPSSLKFGLKLLHDCPNADVDICFVHGLTGDRDKTWIAVGQTTPWPKLLLPSKLNARILMYGYDAHVTRKSVASSNRLINHAQNLLGDLTADRSICNASSRPFIFVAHSLGGLVCKKAILLSQNAAERESRALFDCLEGIAFMGTPHKGAWMADWAKIPASVFGLVKSTNVTLLDILQRDNQLLSSIQLDFLTMIRRLRESGRGIGITCFFEELPFPVVGRIVTEESATLDGYEIYSIYANHRDMVRFGSEEDPGFKRLLWKLLAWTPQVDEKMMNRYTFSAEDRACLKDLQTTNPRDDKSRIEATKGGLLKDSYTWALEDERFQEWHRREKGGGILWVRGDPGKGKTMLLCGIIDELSALKQGFMSYFFCQATDTRLNCATAVLRGLIYMLIDQEPSLISHVRQRYDESGKQLFENPNTWHALSAIIIEMLGHIDDPCLIIDALDECTTDLSSLLDLTVQVSSTHPHVKWIISSRNWPEIKEKMNMFPKNKITTLELNESSVSEAVKIFIYDRVQQLAKLKKYSQQIFDAVHSYLLSNAQGTFLWVALVCEKLAGISRMRTIEKLTAFPPGLDALYIRMMQQVRDHEEAPLCMSILGLVSTTYRPITIDELTIFIDLPECALEDGHESLEEIVGLCGSFLTISERTIFFVHQSAKEYLINKASLDILPAGLSGKNLFILEKSFEAMDKELRRDILAIGRSDDPVSQANYEDLSLGPLEKLRYSCIYWVDHLQDCDQATALHDYLQDGGLVDHFLVTKFLFWLEALSLLKRVPKGLEDMLKLESLTKMTPIYEQVLDASRILRYHKETIEHHPLEIYSSVLLFTPTCSKTKRCFRGEEPDWVKIKPAIENWNPCIQTLVGYFDSFEHLEWAPDGIRLTSTSTQGFIKIWDLASGRCVSSFQAHTVIGICTTWSPNGEYIASTSSDLKLKIWDPETGLCLSTLLGHEFPIKAVFWSEDTTQLVSVSWSSEDGKFSPLTIKVWDRLTGQCVLTVTGDDSQIHSAFPSYGGKGIVSVSSSGIIKTWDIFTDQRISSRKIYPRFENISLWSCDGTNLILSARLSQTIDILDTSSWKSIATLKSESGRKIACIALSQNGHRLASGSIDGSIEIWNLSTRKCVFTLGGHSKSISKLVWLKDGRLTSGSSDTTIKIWDLSTGKCLSTFKGHASGVGCLLASPNEDRLISTEEFASIIKVWDLNSSSAPEEHSQPVKSIVWSNDRAFFASVSNLEIKVWIPTTGECLTTLTSHSGTIGKVFWSNSGEIASLSSDHTLTIWDVSTGQSSQIIKSIEPTAELAWSPDGSLLKLASYDDLIQTWNAVTGQHLSDVKAENIGYQITWSHDATRFASVADDWSIMIRDPYNGNCVLHLHGHCSPEFEHISIFLRRPITMAWSHDKLRLVSEMGPTIKIWDLTTGQCSLVLELDGFFTDLHCHFPRGPAFGESDPGYLHTSIGSFNIQSYLNSTTDDSAGLVCSPQPVGFGLSLYNSWITHNGRSILALPIDYCPYMSTAIAVSGDTVVVGCVTGRVCILEFSGNIFPLGQ